MRFGLRLANGPWRRSIRRKFVRRFQTKVAYSPLYETFCLICRSCVAFEKNDTTDKTLKSLTALSIALNDTANVSFHNRLSCPYGVTDTLILWRCWQVRWNDRCFKSRDGKNELKLRISSLALSRMETWQIRRLNARILIEMERWNKSGPKPMRSKIKGIKTSTIPHFDRCATRTVQIYYKGSKENHVCIQWILHVRTINRFCIGPWKHQRTLPNRS
jgi:hypothetical protein